MSTGIRRKKKLAASESAFEPGDNRIMSTILVPEAIVGAWGMHHDCTGRAKEGIGGASAGSSLAMETACLKVYMGLE